MRLRSTDRRRANPGRAARWLQASKRIASRYGRGHRTEILEMIQKRLPVARFVRRELLWARPRLYLQFFANGASATAVQASALCVSIADRGRSGVLGLRELRADALRHHGGDIIGERVPSRRISPYDTSNPIAGCSVSGRRFPIASRALERIDSVIERVLAPAVERVHRLPSVAELAHLRFGVERMARGARTEACIAPPAQVQLAPVHVAAAETKLAETIAEQTTSPVTAEWPSGLKNVGAGNVEQITDRVIAQIDRRMLAWRERMGRT